MPKSVLKIAGMVLVVAGVVVAILHYARAGSLTTSLITLVVAAVLLVAGLTLYYAGTADSRKQGPGDGSGGR
jgi:uncharacterized protein YjeT (DUF2065 family)